MRNFFYLARKSGVGDSRFLATDDIERFARIGSQFLVQPIKRRDVKLVDL